MLSQRQINVLKAIIEEYVRTNEPVSSRTLTSKDELAFSSATIRNDMAELEDLGYLEKPHTSSGRIPSEKGYRLYVETIMREKENYHYEFPMIDDIFRRENISKDEAINESITLVTDLTKYTSVVLGNSGADSRIKKLQFLALDGRFAIIIMVTDSGHVESKRIIIPEGISVKEIERVVNILDEILSGSLISEIDHKLRGVQNQGIRDFMSYREELVAAIVQAFSKMAKDQYFVKGKNNILEQPEFQNYEKIKNLFNAIENKEILKVVRSDHQGVTIKIGTENEIRALQDCTVITVPYESSSGDRGAISLVGPTRMEYSKVIPLLEYIASNIKKII